jgi:hypothetical protein
VSDSGGGRLCGRCNEPLPQRGTSPLCRRCQAAARRADVNDALKFAAEAHAMRKGNQNTNKDYAKHKAARVAYYTTLAEHGLPLRMPPPAENDRGGKRTMAEHSPGEWRAGGQGATFFVESPERVAAIAKVFAQKSAEETGANARLIAAAPELLDACLLALRVCESNGYGRDLLQPKLREVLSKVEGVTP